MFDIGNNSVCVVDSNNIKKENPLTKVSEGLELLGEDKSSTKMDLDKPILASSHKSSQHFCEVLMEYFCIPLSIFQHHLFRSASAEQKLVLIYLIRKCVWKPTKFDDHGHTIELQPGQVAITIRDLAEEIGVDRNVVARALKKFVCETGPEQIARQEVRHVKTIVTFTHPDICEIIKKRSETSSETRVRQDRDIKEKDKDIKIKEKINKKENSAQDQPDRPINSQSDSSKISLTHSESSDKVVSIPGQHNIKVQTLPPENQSDQSSALAQELAQILLTTIQSYMPSVNPKCISKWSKEMEKLLKAKGENQIREILKWYPQNFYHPNIQSASKFREKFEQLVAYKNQPQSFNNQVDRRTKNPDGTAISHPLDGIL